MTERRTSVLRERLPFYLIGLAIGFTILGLLQMARSAASRPVADTPAEVGEVDGNSSPTSGTP